MAVPGRLNVRIDPQSLFFSKIFEAMSNLECSKLKIFIFYRIFMNTRNEN